MTQFFLNLDTKLFVLINISGQNSFFDWLMPIVTSQLFLNVFLLLIALAIVGYAKKRGAWVVVLLVATVALSDQSSSFLVKPLVKRIRPCHVVEGVHLLVNCTNSFSFPSSHATNSFAAAALLSFYFPAVRIGLYGFALIVSYSRPYVGVHYPGDILGGAILGILCAWIVIFLQKKYLNNVERT